MSSLHLCHIGKNQKIQCLRIMAQIKDKIKQVVIIKEDNPQWLHNLKDNKTPLAMGRHFKFVKAKVRIIKPVEAALTILTHCRIHFHSQASYLRETTNNECPP